MIPKGTPLYEAAFGNERKTVRGWCGVVAESNKQLGYCMFPPGSSWAQGDSWGLGNLAGNGPLYAPKRLGYYEFRPITALDVVEDSGVRSEIPAVTLSYAFVKWTKTAADIEQSIASEGKSFTFNRISLPREPDGSAILRAAGGTYKLTPATDGRGASVEAITTAENSVIDTLP